MTDYTTGQHASRHWRTFTDQHQRKWGATCSKKTGYPCEPLQPQFTAPLSVPHQYVKMDPTDDRMVIIDYDSWLNEIDAANNQWIARIEDIAIQLGVQGTIQQIIKAPPPEVLRLAGEKPNKRKEPVLAARAGNEWVLGMSLVVPSKAREFFPEYFRTPETFKPVDPFKEEVADPFAEDDEAGGTVAPTDEFSRNETVLVPVDFSGAKGFVGSNEIKVTGDVRDLGDGYYLVNGKKYPHWSGPNVGYKLSNNQVVPRESRSTDEYRALAQELERALHVGV